MDGEGVDLKGLNRPMVTAAVILATILQAVDTTIANVALPHMQASLGATRETVTWVLTSYIVSAAVMTPISGWLADRLGLKQLFLIAVTGFVASSMLCGAASTLGAMILFRVAQGAFGAFLVPLSQTVMLGIYPREKHGQAMALWGMAIMVSPILGPILGGWLTDNYSWRWVFYVNLPIGLLAFAGTLIFMPHWDRRLRRFDTFGFVMLAIGVLSLQTMFDRGADRDWFQSWETWIEAAIALAAIWIFLVHLATGRTRLFEPRMLTDRNYSSALVITFMLMSLVMAGAALLPPMLQQLFGYPPVSAGVLMAPRGVGTLVSMFIVGRISTRVDPRLILAVGIGLTTYSLYLMTGFTLEMDSRLIVTSGLIQGFGMGFCMIPTNVLAFQSIPAEMRTDASGLYNLLRGVGGSAGVSIVTTLLARQVQVSHSDIAGRITSSTLQGFDAMLSRAPPLFANGLAMLDMEINRQALMIAYLDVYRVMMFAMMLTFPLLLLIRPPKRKPAADEVMAFE